MEFTMKSLKYYLFVLGCQMNKSDAERIAGLVECFGFTATLKPEEANLIAVVACSVRQSAVNRIKSRISGWNRIKKSRKAENPLIIILTGCVLPADRKIFAKQFDLVLDTYEVPERLTEALEESFGTKSFENKQKCQFVIPSPVPKQVLGSGPSLPRPASPAGRDPSLYSQKGFLDSPSTRLGVARNDNTRSVPILTPLLNITSADFFGLAPVYSSNFQAYVPIQTGCNNFCSYCAVPYTKGREKYRPYKEIVQEVKKLVQDGYKEITLLGQNVNTYFDPALKDAIGARQKYRQWSALTDFPRLLRLIADISGNWWLRFVTSNPWDMSEETIKAVADCERICEYIHLPLQSGSDRILKLMNRHHTQKDYLELIDKIRAIIPGVAISTDIIVGFPGEAEADFLATAKVMEQAKFDMAYLARYSPRPGTVAAKMMKDDISAAEKIRREKYLELILRQTALFNNQNYIGKEVEVLIESIKYKVVSIKYEEDGIKNNESSIKNGNKMLAFGKTRTFKTVKFKTDRDCVGQFVSVKITEAREFGLEGELCKKK
ncbi:MAG TPA: hypothetical protein DDX47_05010 [Candidatus Jacksonbacteria bacterium]|nr:MAG: Radical SAM methylthiotransferase, MiaB/RimO family [Parcubacteria group bacterium GW2011_GWC2_44_22]HBH46690.1 hypothetical protein [Candidatus Jacksonbacteria bacterium]HCC49612.1 hypothetical protein [Candidatus Jacksonbacteria bacterium]HCR15385.1 hypothetical protein [Candidatus Jacksonbacteria bacterium]